MTLNLSVPSVAKLDADFARRHAEWLRDLASIILAHELCDEPLPTVQAIEEQAIAFESRLHMPQPPGDPQPRLRAVGGL